MKKQRKMYLALCAASAAICIGNTVPALAATCGDVTSVTSDSISGWVWEVGEFDTVLPVEVQILSDKGRGTGRDSIRHGRTIQPGSQRRYRRWLACFYHSC